MSNDPVFRLVRDLLDIAEANGTGYAVERALRLGLESRVVELEARIIELERDLAIAKSDREAMEHEVDKAHDKLADYRSVVYGTNKDAKGV